MGKRKALTIPPPADPGVPLDDPELLAADLPQSAPQWWHREIGAELEDAP